MTTRVGRTRRAVVAGLVAGLGVAEQASARTGTATPTANGPNVAVDLLGRNVVTALPARPALIGAATVTLPPGATYPTRADVDPSASFLVVESGTLEVEAIGTVTLSRRAAPIGQPLPTGVPTAMVAADSLFVGPGQRFALRNRSAAPASVLTVQISPME